MSHAERIRGLNVDQFINLVQGQFGLKLTRDDQTLTASAKKEAVINSCMESPIVRLDNALGEASSISRQRGHYRKGENATLITQTISVDLDHPDFKKTAASMTQEFAKQKIAELRSCVPGDILRAELGAGQERP